MLEELFPGAELTGNQIKIPKSALPRLESNPVTAAQFFAAVLLRGVQFFPDNLLFREDYKIAVTQGQAYYVDFAANRIVVLFRTEITLNSTNLEEL